MTLLITKLLKKLFKDDSLSDDIKQLILTELNARHNKNNVTSSSLKSSPLTSDGYEYRYTKTYQVEDFQKLSNRLNFWAAGSSLVATKKGSLKLGLVSGVLWIYSAYLNIVYEDFTSV